MKKILFVSSCTKRGNTTGLTGKLLDSLANADRQKYEINLFDTGFFESNHNPNDNSVEHYYGLPKYKIEKLVRKIPYVRSVYAKWLIVNQFKKIAKNGFDLVVIYQISNTSEQIVKIAHKFGAKVMLYPWGSDILCCSGSAKKHIRNAFNNSDFVGGAPKSNCILAVQYDYGVPGDKIKLHKNYLSGVNILQNIDCKISRAQMHESLFIPYSEYNIVCCYSGNQAHNHNVVLDAIIENKSILPEGYQLIFPMTYGATETYYESIKKRCIENQLNAFFLREFITNEQMAYLHLVTDLFINIQNSDCGNAFMIEALFAKNRIVTGRWLHYEQFEQFGVPYHLIDKPEDLSAELYLIFSNQEPRPVIPEQLIEMYRIPEDYVEGSYWTNIFDNL